MSDEEFVLSEKKTPFRKVVTNEGFLFVWRMSSLACGLVVLWFAQDMRATQNEVAKDLNAFKLLYTGAIATMQGDVRQLGTRVDVHAERLNGLGADIRDINSRMYQMHKTTPN